MSHSTQPQLSISSLKGAQYALYLSLCFFLIGGVFTEFPYAFFQWDVLTRAFKIIGFGALLGKIVSFFLVPFDTFTQIFLLTPIKTAKEMSMMSLRGTSWWKMLVFAFANFWYFTNFFAEALGIGSVTSGSVKTGLVWLDFLFAMASYNLLFTGDIFRGIDAIFNKGLPVDLFKKSKLLFFHASMILLASIADWGIQAFYTGRRSAGEVLHDPSSGNIWGGLSTFFSVVFMLLSQLPETFNYVYESINISEFASDNLLSSSLKRRGKIIAASWGVLRGVCFGTLVGNSILNHVKDDAMVALPIFSGLMTALFFSVLTYKASYQHFVNEQLSKNNTGYAVGSDQSVGLKRFKGFLMTVLFISMFQRRVQAIEFNDKTFAQVIDKVNAIAWMGWLLPEQAMSYGLFLWRRVKDVAPERYDHFSFIGSKIADKVRPCAESVGHCFVGTCNFFAAGGSLEGRYLLENSVNDGNSLPAEHAV